MLTIVTAGVWVVPWAFVSMSNSSKQTQYKKELKKLYDFKNKYDKHDENDETDKLFKLSMLLKDGYITQDEFNRQKAKIDL